MFIKIMSTINEKRFHKFRIQLESTMTRQNHFFQKTALLFFTVAAIAYMIGTPLCVYSEESNILYIRSDIKIINGREVENNLLMVPADEEFRITAFAHYNVTGICQGEAKPDPFSAAKHNAFKNLLRSFGVKSIRNKNESQKTHLHDESVLSYEGFIKTTYIITSQGFDPGKNIFKVDMEIEFAPLAYPSEWRFRHFKKKLYDTLKNMISVFL